MKLKAARTLPFLALSLLALLVVPLGLRALQDSAKAASDSEAPLSGESLVGEWQVSTPIMADSRRATCHVYERLRLFADGTAVRLSGWTPGIYYVMKHEAQTGTWRLEGRTLVTELSAPVPCSHEARWQPDFRPDLPAFSRTEGSPVGKVHRFQVKALSRAHLVLEEGKKETAFSAVVETRPVAALAAGGR